MDVSALSEYHDAFEVCIEGEKSANGNVSSNLEAESSGMCSYGTFIFLFPLVWIHRYLCTYAVYAVCSLSWEFRNGVFVVREEDFIGI